MNKSLEGEKTKSLFQYLLPNFKKKYKTNKSTKKDSMLIPSISIKNKKRRNLENFQHLKLMNLFYVEILLNNQ